AVPGAHTDPVEASEHVELRHREAREAVHADRHPKHDEVEPPDPSRTSSRRPVFATASFPQVFRDRPFQLGWERARTDPRGERLRDSDDVREVLRPDAGSDGGGSRDAVARGSVRIDSVVYAEVGPLGPFEQDAL